MRRILMALTAVLVLAAGAAAKDTAVDTALDDAKVLARKGDPLKAAERFGDAVAIAQAAGDLQAEATAADAMAEFLRDVMIQRMTARPAEPGATAEQAPATGNLLAAAMKRLEAGRCGAYVSAPVLARTILLLASETGDTSGVDDAARVAAAHATKASSGRAAPVVARYAQGLKAAVEKRFDAATGPLDTAMKDAGKAGWFDLASHAGTELAAAWVGAGDAANATAALDAVAALCKDDTPRHAVRRWQDCVNARLADAPEAVRKSAEDAFKRLLAGGESVSAAGGRGGKGGAGGNADEEPISDVGRLLRKLGKGKPIVTATCTAKGIDVHWLTAPGVKCLVPFEDGEKVADEGGVTVSCSRHAIALRMVDLVGNRGQPGESSEMDPLRAYYLLAEGETWSVSKEGVVTISR